MKTGTYNGWKNYETWAVHLWMTDDADGYKFWEDRAKSAVEIFDGDAEGKLAAEIKDHHEDEMPECSGVYGDLMSAALGAVDWYEIAEALIGNAKSVTA